MNESFTSESSVGEHAQKGIARADLLARLRESHENSYELVPRRPQEVEEPEQAADAELSSFAIFDDAVSGLRWEIKWL